MMLITHGEHAGRCLEPWRGPGVSRIHPVPERRASLPGAAAALMLHELGRGIRLICPHFLVPFCHGKRSLHQVVECKPTVRASFRHVLPSTAVCGREVTSDVG